MGKRLSFQALNTNFAIEVYNDLQLIHCNHIYDLCKEFESDFTRFNPDSKLNLYLKDRAIPTTEENFEDLLVESSPNCSFQRDLNELLHIARNLRIISNNKFNISIRSTIEKLGYDKSFESIGQNNSRSYSSQSYLTIDLGGIGKGYLINKISKYLLSVSDSDFLINGGGDIFFHSGQNKSTKIHLNEIEMDLEISSGGIACSSTKVRKWMNDKHHIIDPVSKTSKAYSETVYIMHKDITYADGCCKIALLTDPKEFPTLEKRLGIKIIAINNRDIYFSKSIDRIN